MPPPPPLSSVHRGASDAAQQVSPGGVKLFGEDGFNFRDVLDLVNPLQHIPLVGNLYRKLTGDLAAPAIRVAGGALFGGPLGAAFAAASVVLARVVGGPAQSPSSPAENTAVAAAPRPTESRGGWMVAQQRAFALPATAAMAAPAVAVVDPLELGRTYRLEAIEAGRHPLFGSFHLQA